MFVVTFSEKGEVAVRKNTEVWQLSSWKWKLAPYVDQRLGLNDERVVVEVVLSEQSQHAELRWVHENKQLILWVVNPVKTCFLSTRVFFLTHPSQQPKALYLCPLSPHLGSALISLTHPPDTSRVKGTISCPSSQQGVSASYQPDTRSSWPPASHSCRAHTTALASMDI